MTTLIDLDEEVRTLVKEAVQATGDIMYPDLVLFVSARLLRNPIDNALERLEKKGMIDRHSDAMGAVISRVSKQDRERLDSKSKEDRKDRKSKSSGSEKTGIKKQKKRSRT